MPNPKGTPENLQPFTTDRDEPLSEKLTVRITKSMDAEIKSQDNPPEFVREAIQKALDGRGK
ncbi:hypothetical protein NIES4074_53160 [Cylindrospermum sp. NIES-4074]|nr:hypothetical protein NIES4074_53160 [Cylindrospermum sp. NIES-4074]